MRGARWGAGVVKGSLRPLSPASGPALLRPLPAARRAPLAKHPAHDCPAPSLPPLCLLEVGQEGKYVVDIDKAFSPADLSDARVSVRWRSGRVRDG